MTKQSTNTSTAKSKALVRLEYVLLGLCLCVIAIRATFVEGPPMRASTMGGNLGDNLYSLSVSTVLIFAFVLWVVWSICGKRFLYRPTGTEIGLGMFCLAAVFAGFAAVDKRLAITDITVFLAPLLMALLLVQILDSRSKVRLLLALIAALGIVSTYRCWEQYSENEHSIESYEKNPSAVLAQVPQRIEPGSLEHFQFEHRLYSKDISSFFTTSNSAGSFALLASFAATVLFIGRFRSLNSDSLGPAWLIMRGIAVAIVGFGLIITRSKGAIIASLFALTMFVAHLCFGNWLRLHKKLILIVCLILVVAGVWGVIQYGSTHSRLPGGNSMLVRWQYWRASAKMVADHPLTGVGPGNFTHFYPHYKPASASESVANPHNFVLSILTQYGPVGLIGFLFMICLPLWTILFPRSTTICRLKVRQPQPTFKQLAIVLAVIVSAVFLFIRPIIFPLPPTSSAQERNASIIILYLMPMIVFIAGFLLVTAGEEPARKPYSSSGAAALLCAVLGVLVHNLIDFAIFEPGVSTAFWAIMACLIVIDSQTNPRPLIVPKFTTLTRILVVTATLAAGGGYLAYALIPVARSTAKIRQANQAISARQFEYAHKLLEKAAGDDSLSALALSLNGGLYQHHFAVAQKEDRELLLRSVECLKAAIERNSAAFKNFERLTEVYGLLAEISGGQERNDWLNKALDTASEAVERYPGCGRLHFKLARIAEQADKTDVALKHYSKAIEIEDAYRDQFRRIYPERKEVVSRLGEEKYRLAIEGLKELSEVPLR